MANATNIPDLLDRLHTNDATVLSALFKAYNHRLLYFAKSLVHDTAVAEEIVADTFVKLWQGRHRIQHKDHVKAFLYIATKNACLNYLKSSHAKQHFDYELDEAMLTADPEIYVKLIRTEFIQDIHHALQQLPPKQRDVFKLSFLDGLRTDEICQALNLSPNAVFANRSRALETLRKLLKNHRLSLFFLLWHTFS